jgi:hypothetical protein
MKLLMLLALLLHLLLRLTPAAGLPPRLPHLS